MLTPDEKKFLADWPQRRLTYKRGLRKYVVGLPLAIFIVIAVLVNVGVGWYSRADAELRGNSSVFITVLIAALGIIIFMGEFASRYKFGQLEQKWLELQQKAKDDNL